MESTQTAPDSGANRPDRPRFTRVTPYNAQDRKLSFWYASEWGLDASDSPHTCITLTPDPDDPASLMTVSVQDMGMPVSADDRNIVLEGVEDGLGQLDRVDIERMSDLDKPGDWGLEWVCTFEFDGQRRKRRARLFFADRLQYSMMFQGSTIERFDYWKGMFEWTMLTIATTGFSLQDWAEASAIQWMAEEGMAEGGGASG